MDQERLADVRLPRYANLTLGGGSATAATLHRELVEKRHWLTEDSEVMDLKRQAQELKEVVAEQALELRLLKKSMIGDGGDEE